MKIMILRRVLAGMVFATSGMAHGGDHLFDEGFESHPEGPYSDADASRFLTQASFGPTVAEIARLRRIGYNAWLADQVALEPS